MSVLYWIALQLLRFWSLITGVKYYGRENVESISGGVIVMANHTTVLDPLLMGVACRRRPVRFVAKIELFSNKIFAKILKNLGAIAIDRDNMDLSALREILSLLKKGELLGIFPEGTRNNGVDLLPFKSGTMLMAAKGKATIVPVAIVNSKNLFKFWRTRPYVIIGESYVLPEGKVSTDMLNEYSKEAENKVSELWHLAPAQLKKRG